MRNLNDLVWKISRWTLYLQISYSIKLFCANPPVFVSIVLIKNDATKSNSLWKSAAIAVLWEKCSLKKLASSGLRGRAPVILSLSLSDFPDNEFSWNAKNRSLSSSLRVGTMQKRSMRCLGGTRNKIVLWEWNYFYDSWNGGWKC